MDVFPHNTRRLGPGTDEALLRSPSGHFIQLGLYCTVRPTIIQYNYCYVIQVMLSTHANSGSMRCVTLLAANYYWTTAE
jgi:hypothetical protein